MKNLVEIRNFIDLIVSSEMYEGDFGGCISDVNSLLSEVDFSERLNVPGEYLEFLGGFGCGELDSVFYVESGLAKYADIVGVEVGQYKDMYVFAGGSNGLLYAFDASAGWSIVKISSESDGFEYISHDFSEFMLSKLRYVHELILWRETN